MGLTSFPHGISSMGIPQLGSSGLIPVTTGSYFWVDSSVGDNGTGSSDSPVKTLMAAYALCTASKGDVIIMKPGHAETIATNAALTLNKIGVTVVGLGSGALRPTITLTGTTAAVTIAVSGASQTLRNFIVSPGVDELTACFTVSAANVTIDGVDFVEASASFQALSFVAATTTANFLTVQNCRAVQVTAATGNAPCITLVGADDAVIMNNTIFWIGANNAATCGISTTGTECLRMTIVGNTLHITGGASVLGISLLASTTGLAAYNNVAVTKTAVAGSIALASVYGVQNYSTETVNTNGILDPIAT